MEYGAFVSVIGRNKWRETQLSSGLKHYKFIQVSKTKAPM
jgi:hypothetical protein